MIFMPGKKPIRKKVKLRRARNEEEDEENLVYHVYLPHKIDEKAGEPISYHRTGRVLLFKSIIQKSLVNRLPNSAKEAGLKWGDKCFEVSLYPYEDAYGDNPPKIGLGHDVQREAERVILKNHPDINSLVIWTNKDDPKIPKNLGYTHIHELDRLNKLGFKFYAKKLKKPKK